MLLRRGIRIALSLFGLFLNLFGVSSVRILGGVAYGPSRLVLDSIGLFGLCTLISGLSDAHVVNGIQLDCPSVRYWDCIITFAIKV